MRNWGLVTTSLLVYYISNTCIEVVCVGMYIHVRVCTDTHTHRLCVVVYVYMCAQACRSERSAIGGGPQGPASVFFDIASLSGTWD